MFCDYGCETFVGARTFVNVGLVCLDVAAVTTASVTVAKVVSAVRVAAFAMATRAQWATSVARDSRTTVTRIWPG